jgi:hypothetical protein
MKYMNINNSDMTNNVNKWQVLIRADINSESSWDLGTPNDCQHKHTLVQLSVKIKNKTTKEQKKTLQAELNSVKESL